MAAREDSPSLKPSDSAQEVYLRDNEKHVGEAPPAEVIDHAAERKLVRKIDLYIMPLFFFLYMLCFLDR